EPVHVRSVEARPGSVKQYSWGPVRCSRPAGAALLRCPQTPSASVSALALGLPRLGARALLAPCGRCAAPMPPDPVGRRERPRARPPTPGGPCAARALRALRCSDAPRPRSAGVSALALASHDASPLLRST